MPGNIPVVTNNYARAVIKGKSAGMSTKVSGPSYGAGALGVATGAGIGLLDCT